MNEAYEKSRAASEFAKSAREKHASEMKGRRIVLFTPFPWKAAIKSARL